ncbi:MAG TPA: RNA methyltransferase [Candidatus Polarisedimenticolia bacterium]|nr:RNA methyltransferase [Candidatus Polarisedimenticolia bacterium]
MAIPPDASPPIASRKNPLMRRITRLEKEPRLREEQGRYLLWGWKMAEEALRRPGDLERLLIGAALARQASGRALLRRAAKLSIPISLVEDRVLDEAAPGAGDQGVLALVKILPASLEQMVDQRPDPVLLITDRIQDPGNLGTLVRLAETAGLAGIVAAAGTVDPYHSRAVRASAGSILRVPVARTSGAAELAPWCRRRGLRIAVSLSEGGVPCEQADLRGSLALVVGNEGEGIGADWLDVADLRLTVRLAETSQSLNVSQAGAILLYEMIRQRRSERTKR